MRSRRAAFLQHALIPACLLLAFVAGLRPHPLSAQSENENEACFELDDYTLAADERLDCNLFVLGGSFYLEEGAEVDGSVNVMSGSARIDGLLTGDAWAVRDMEIGGRVDGSAAALFGTIKVSGEVGGDLAALNGDVEIAPEARVGGDVTASGDVDLAGRVEGDVSIDGNLRLEEGASIGGDARVSGEIDDAVEGQIGGRRELRSMGAAWLTQLISALAMVLFTAIFAALAVGLIPRRIQRLRGASEAAKLPTLFLGILALVLAPIFALLILPVLLYVVAITLGLVGAGESLGARLLPGAGRKQSAALGSSILAAIYGLAPVALSFDLEGLPMAVALCGSVSLLVLLSAWLLGCGLITLLGGRPWPRALPDRGQATDPVAAGPPEAPSGPTRNDGPATAAPPDVVDAPPSVEPPPSGDAGAFPAGPAEDEVRTEAALAELRQVSGITPIYAGLLVESGIRALDDLAAAEPRRLVEIVSSAGVLPVDLALARSWVEAARARQAGRE